MSKQVITKMSTALLLKQKKNKIPGFYIACTSGDPQAMESAWDKRINLFYRSSLKAGEKQNSWFLYRLYVRRPTSYGKRVGQKGSPFTRWMGATGGKKDQRPKSDEQVTSYHQKCQWNKIADFLLYRFWEVHSQGEWGQPAEKKTRDQNLMSKSQFITKNVNEIKLQISCCWKIQNLWMSNFSQLEVSTVVFKHQKQGYQLDEISCPVDR